MDSDKGNALQRILGRLESASEGLEENAKAHKHTLENVDKWDNYFKNTSDGVTRMATAFEAMSSEMTRQGAERRDLIQIQNEERKTFRDAVDPRKTVPLNLVLLLFAIVGVLLIFDRVSKSDKDLEIEGTRLKIYRQGQLVNELEIEKDGKTGLPPKSKEDVPPR